MQEKDLVELLQCFGEFLTLFAAKKCSVDFLEIPVHEREISTMADEQYVVPRRMQKRYEQRFRDAWLENPLLKDWLRDYYTPEGLREARCIYCNIRLCPRFIDLSKHAMTRKHMKNTPHEGTSSIIVQSSDNEETEDIEEQGEVEEYETIDPKNENIMYEVILDHPHKEDDIEQQEEVTMEQLDESRNSSSSPEPPLKILKMGFKKDGGDPEGHKEQPVLRKVKATSTEPNILLERKKLVLQIKNEELRAYKLQLEAFKMERELGFGRSIFTRNLPTKSNL